MKSELKHNSYVTLDNFIVTMQKNQLDDIIKRVETMDTKNSPFSDCNTEYGAGWNNALSNLGDYLRKRSYQLGIVLEIPLDDRD